MSNKELWNNFLEIIKNEITNISFETWFNEDDTKFYSFENENASLQKSSPHSLLNSISSLREVME